MACFKTDLLEQHMRSFARGDYDDILEDMEDNLVLESPAISPDTKTLSTGETPLDNPSSETAKHTHPGYCPICNTLINQNLFSSISFGRIKFVNHMKHHIDVACSLCFSIMKFNFMGTHTSRCRLVSGASSTCPICKILLPDKKPSKHFKMHVPPFHCPYPQCSKMITFNETNSHMRIHFNEFFSSQYPSFNKSGIGPLPIDSLSARIDRCTHSDEPPLPTVPPPVPTAEFQCEICHQSMSATDRVIRSHIYSHILHECPICLTQGLDESQFESHIKICLLYQTNPQQCPLCSRSFAIQDATSISHHIHGKHSCKMFYCQGCQQSLTCVSLNSHHIECLKKPRPILTVDQQSILSQNKIGCVICRNKIEKIQFSSHFTEHFLFKCLFCDCVSPYKGECMTNISTCISKWLVARLNQKVFNCPFCSVSVTSVSFSNHIHDRHIHLCPLCNTVVERKSLSYHGLMCTVNNLDLVSSISQDDQLFLKSPLASIDTLPDTEVNQHSSFNSVDSDCSISDFVCPFCDANHAAAGIDLIRSHLLSCGSIPPQIQVVALPNLVGFRLIN